MKRRALFIGVNEYKDPEIRALKCACRDAISMHDIFEMLGYQTMLLENPSKVDVFNAIRDMTAGNDGEDALKNGDQFLMYFSGHGFSDSGQHLLFCVDDMYKQLRHHRAGIPFDQLEEETRSGGYDRVFLLDSCQSDFLMGTKGEDTTTRDLVAIGDMVPKAEDAAGAFYVLRSCSKFEHALEVESRKHGLFTLGMLEVLRQSKKDNMELAFNDSFREFVRKKMWDIAAELGLTVRQTPESEGRGNVQILLQKNYAGEPPTTSRIVEDISVKTFETLSMRSLMGNAYIGNGAKLIVESSCHGSVVIGHSGEFQCSSLIGDVTLGNAANMKCNGFCYGNIEARNACDLRFSVIRGNVRIGDVTELVCEKTCYGDVSIGKCGSFRCAGLRGDVYIGEAADLVCEGSLYGNVEISSGGSLVCKGALTGDIINHGGDFRIEGRFRGEEIER